MATRPNLKKLSGIDLNGIQDLAARNWILNNEGEETFFDSEPYINLGSVRSSVIKVDTPSGSELIGGVQASLAPHGRGGGFGQIGKIENRTPLIEIINSEETETDKLSAALSALSPPSAHTIVSISDSSSTSEIYQDNLLKALRKNKERSYLLIWRSVLTALSQIHLPEIMPGTRVGLINHSLQGLDIQTLEIKETNVKNQILLVPERKTAGVSIETDFGYRGLFDTVKSYLETLTTDRMLDVGQSNNLGLMALGQQTQSELVRSETGAWRELKPQKSITDLLKLNDLHLESLNGFFAGCDLLLFESFCTGQLEARIRAKLQTASDKKIIAVHGMEIAKAALYAAKRLEQDFPIYFDFLPQISTIVRSGLETKSADLIDQSETLRAGKVFRSREPAEFAINPQAERIEVFLKKETEEKPRKSVVELHTPPGSAARVMISVEQIPALGRATIQLKADSIGLNRNLDWDQAEILDETWDEIIQRQEAPVVPIPERLVVEASDFNWSDADRDGLETLLEQAVQSSSPNWMLLAQRAYKSFSSDGEIPEYVSTAARENLKTVNDKAMELIELILCDEIKSDNEILKFLTYQYKKCPSLISLTLLNLWQYRFVTGFSHPFIIAPASWVLIFQGFGRIVFDPNSEEEAIKKLVSIPIKNWRWREQTACMSFLLSRSETAHQFLNLDNIPLLLDRIKIEFRENIGTAYNKFYYAPFLLAGLLRYREFDSSFLVLGADPVAENIDDLLDITIEDLNSNQQIGATNKQKYLGWLEEIKTYMRGEQGNPNLLLDIYNN